MTSSETIEIALLAKLIESGGVRESARSLDLIRRYEKAGWIMPSGRRGEWVARPETTIALTARLAKLLPQWESDFALLRTHNLDPRKPQDIEALPVLRKRPDATGLINRRNWTAAGGLGPKRKGILETEATLTSDWVMRLRPNRGLVAQWDDHSTDLWEMAKSLTECPIPQRKWMRLQEFTGTLPAVVITCENLGAYIDLPLPENALAIFSPGKHIETAVELLKRIPVATWVHFGDIDQEGLDIADQLADATRRPIHRYIPSFCMEYIADDMAQNKDVKWQGTFEHPALKLLAERNLGVFQEVFMLDPRFDEDLRSFCIRSQLST